jgi:hypothetical protein
MSPTNLERMVALADQFFDVKSDPEQLAVDDEVRRKLRALHPATMNEEGDEAGPIAWVLVIPTSHAVMERFLRKEISEKALLDEAVVSPSFEAIYLCSALVLPEHRKKGVAKRLAVQAVQRIQAGHQVREVYCWPFSDEGRRLARAIAGELHVPLFER